ncbi:MAG: hypothetical protein IJN93_05185 [Clostridia bacterium]|nr:hypothetical protein [Clostridia bacterium]
MPEVTTVISQGGSSMTQVTTVVTSMFTQMGEVVKTMLTEGNELMLIPIGIFVAGAAIGLASRLIGR